MQSGLLFQSLYNPESDAYFIQTVFNLDRESFTISALKQAWQKILQLIIP
jgi:hypothetical protein